MNAHAQSPHFHYRRRTRRGRDCGALRLRAQAKLEKTKVAIAVGGKAAFYYLPLTISEQLGYFKAEGLDVEISDFAGGARALQAAGRRLGRRVLGRLRAHHQPAGQEPVLPVPSCCRAGRRRSRWACRPRPCRATRPWPTCKGKKIGVSAPGSSTNMVANLVLSRGGLKASDVSFIGVGTAAGALAALRSGQIDAMQQHRSGDDHARAEGRREDHQRHAHAQGHAGGVRRPDAGGLPVRAAEFIQKNPNTCQALANAIVHGLKWLQTAGPGRHHQDRAGDLPAGRPRAVPGVVRQGARSDRARRPGAGRGPEDRAQGAGQLRPHASRPTRSTWRKTYTNEFARRAKEKFKA